MKMLTSKNYQILFGMIIFCFMAQVVSGQKTISEDQQAYSEDKDGCGQLELFSQENYSAENIKPPSDVLILVPDDITSRFKLTNGCDKTIYYLATIIDEDPWGYFLYRKEGNEWKARTPAWRRKRGLTGSLYRWLPLEANKSITFEFTDLSCIEGERSIAIYIKYASDQEDIIEIMADPYFPIKRDTDCNPLSRSGLFVEKYLKSEKELLLQFQVGKGRLMPARRGLSFPYTDD